MGRPVNFDSPLPDRDLTQKLHNKLYDVHNNNNNVLENFRKMYRLYTRRTAQLAAGGPVSGELLYILSVFLYFKAVEAGLHAKGCLCM